MQKSIPPDGSVSSEYAVLALPMERYVKPDNSEPTHGLVPDVYSVVVDYLISEDEPKRWLRWRFEIGVEE
ncbi:hypothetical protein [Haladaptatus sp. DFWS20]|uniref:hypothetical protein n=1 Tax=Haladaptatus sp. DFWS20 TaxID=3403467 RepID=UPI003EBBB39C